MNPLSKIFIGFFLLLSIAGAIKAQPTITPDIDPNTPVLKFEKDTINYGKVEYKADGWRTLKIKNTGKQPLIIQEVQPTCGCTTVDLNGKKTYTTEPIAPGKSGVIKVHYATERVGPFLKTITVSSNGKEKQMVFYIKGEVKPSASDAGTKKNKPLKDSPNKK